MLRLGSRGTRSYSLLVQTLTAAAAAAAAAAVAAESAVRGETGGRTGGGAESRYCILSVVAAAAISAEGGSRGSGTQTRWSSKGEHGTLRGCLLCSVTCLELLSQSYSCCVQAHSPRLFSALAFSILLCLWTLQVSVPLVRTVSNRHWPMRHRRSPMVGSPMRAAACYLPPCGPGEQPGTLRTTHAGSVRCRTSAHSPSRTLGT